MKRTKRRNHQLKWVYFAFAGISLLLLSCSSKQNSSSTKTSSAEEGTLALTTYRKSVGGLSLFLNGVNDKNKEDLASSIFEAFNNKSKDALKFSDSSFVDADKYCYNLQGFDSFHCWLASTSNILRISGWAEDFKNPLISERSASYEDDLLSFFTSSLSDAGGSSEWALSYFFTGILGKSVSAGGANLITSPTKVKPFDASSFNGYMPSVCSTYFAKSSEIADNLSALSLLETLESNALELSISKFNVASKESIADSAHSLTVVGALIDEEKEGKERYKALLIADSDNEVSAANLPSSFEEASKAKKEKTNSYTLYFTDTFDGKFGFYYNGDFAQINEITCLPFKSDEVISKAKESADYATCDKSKNADLVPSFFSIYGEDNFTDTFKVGEKISATFIYKNRNESCAMNQENAGKEILENTVSVYRNGVLVGNISEGLNYDLSKEIKPSCSIDGILTLSDSSLFSLPGEYKVAFNVNSNQCKEAYILNNDPVVRTFTIVE